MKIITTGELEIANMFLEDIAQGNWSIKLDKTDFETAPCGSKPIVSVKVEDDKSIGELSTIAFDEIKKTGCKPAYFIMIISYRQGDELMMQDLSEFNDCASTYIDKKTDFKWGVQSLNDMPCKRRITIIVFAQDKQAEDKEKSPRQESLWKKLSGKLSVHNKMKTTNILLTSICLEIITGIDLMHVERNRIYRCDYSMRELRLM